VDTVVSTAFIDRLSDDNKRDWRRKIDVNLISSFRLVATALGSFIVFVAVYGNERSGQMAADGWKQISPALSMMMDNEFLSVPSEDTRRSVFGNLSSR
jgi:hypothetical protein